MIHMRILLSRVLLKWTKHIIYPYVIVFTLWIPPAKDIHMQNFGVN